MGCFGKSLALVLVFVFIVSLVTIQPETVKAGSTKTITVPDDYPDIQSAINNANDGDTIFVKQGEYRLDASEPNWAILHINKSISLYGDNRKTILSLSTFAYYGYHSFIYVTANDVSISGLRIDGAIYNYTNPKWGDFYPVVEDVKNSILVESNNTKVFNNAISNAEFAEISLNGQNNSAYNNDINGEIQIQNIGSSVYQNTVSSIYVSSSNSYIYKNFISGGSGITVDSCSNVTIAENNIKGNTGGINLRWDGPFYVFGNNITNNQGYGIQFGESCNNASVYANNVFGNEIGFILYNYAIVRYSPVGSGNVVFSNNIVNNSKNAYVESSIRYPHLLNREEVTGNGTDVVSWDNGTVGNYWSDYNGIGAYVINYNNIDNYPLKTLTDISSINTPTSTPQNTSVTSRNRYDLNLLILIAIIIVLISAIATLLLVFTRHRKTAKA
jgi:hypothetical protein